MFIGKVVKPYFLTLERNFVVMSNNDGMFGTFERNVIIVKC